MDNTFKFTMPAELEKSKDGSWKIKGLASTEDMDRQGEILIQKGMDLTHIDEKKGFLNWDHSNKVEDLVGTLDGYQRTSKGLYIEGKLFKSHDKAKAIHAIMEGLAEDGRKAIGLSVEGAILERDPKNSKIIKKCKIKNVALTLNPVNTSTYADLVKSFNDSEAIDFDATEENLKANEEAVKEEPTFTTSQVLSIIQKALAISTNVGNIAPAAKMGADALTQSTMSEKEEEDKKKKEKEKPAKTSIFKSSLIDILDRLQILYPECTRSELWYVLQERLDQRFPNENE